MTSMNDNIHERRLHKPRRSTSAKSRKNFVTKHEVKNMLSNSTETKYQAANVVAAAIDDTGTFRVFGGIAQSTDVNGRIGNKISCKSFISRSNVTYTGTPATLREIIFTIKADGTNFATPGLANLLTDPSNPVTSSYNIQYVSNDAHNNQRPYRILSDRIIDVDVNNQRRSWKTRVAYKRSIGYTGTGNALSNINANPLFKCLVSDQVTFVGNPPTVTTDEVLYYQDI